MKLQNPQNAIAPPPAWATGDHTRLPIPAHAEALLEGGAIWLTRAFRAFGALSIDNRVTAITHATSFSGGGTGSKLRLSLSYEKQENGLFNDLFVKFSRNFDDPAMDSARFHMEPEVRFAALSQSPNFPIAVPPCLFADFEHSTGTGLLITRAIPFGQEGIESQYSKCLDHEIPEALQHYRALIRALARLAGSFKGGRLPGEIVREFPWDQEKALAADRLPYTAERLQRRVSRYAAFAQAHAELLPEAIRTPEFIAALARGTQMFLAHEDAIKTMLHDRQDFIALCHWNANADNAWFWRGGDGELNCGLLDWGSVGQLHLAMSLWGCLSGAERWLWQDHLEELLVLFVAEYRLAGGPQLEIDELRLHLLFYAAMMGLCWLMDAPLRIQREVPDLADCHNRFDPRILVSETARVQLQMMTNFLAFWQEEDLTSRLDKLFEPTRMIA